MIKHSGELDRRITIQEFSESVDTYGQRVKSFLTLATVWSKVVEGIGKEGEEGEQITASKKVDFVIRYRNDINEQMRVVYNSNTYKIEAIQIADARKAFLMIRTKWAD
jgi:SPP1 family predicted phage head-tail adaptor